MKSVWVFFYGTFMSTKILQEYGINCAVTIPAELNGYELAIRPRVNLNQPFTGRGLFRHAAQTAPHPCFYVARHQRHWPSQEKVDHRRQHEQVHRQKRHHSQVFGA